MRSRMARRFVALGITPGDRIALVAETGRRVRRLLLRRGLCRALPVPLPLPTSFGGRDAYVDQLDVQLDSCDPKLFLFPAELDGSAATRPPSAARCPRLGKLAELEPHGRLAGGKPDDIAYLQYSSGSTRFPHGVAVTHEALLANLHAHGVGLEVLDSDRCISWLPWYHDMGLVGCFLSPIALQLSVDYLKTEDFARRPLAWLDMISRNPGTSVSYSPTFGYDICARRMSSQTRADDRFDLSRWRIAGNGADMIRPDVMQAFVDCFDEAGFKASAFCPSYGLAEATLAVSLMPPGEGIRVELVEENELSGGTCGGGERPRRYRAVVNCGRPVDRDEDRDPRRRRRIMPDRGIGKVFVHGTSVMDSYFRDQESTEACLSDDGWLDTGDMGYLSGGYIFIVGRAKDMIIINGRNHWPQDIEWAVEQLPGFKSGDIAAFAITGPSGEETPAVLVHCRVSDPKSAAGFATTSARGSGRSPASRPVVELFRRAPCPAPARASCREPKRAAFICPAKSSLTTSPPDAPSVALRNRFNPFSIHIGLSPARVQVGRGHAAGSRLGRSQGSQSHQRRRARPSRRRRPGDRQADQRLQRGLPPRKRRDVPHRRACQHRPAEDGQCPRPGSLGAARLRRNPVPGRPRHRLTSAPPAPEMNAASRVVAPAPSC